MSVPAFLTTHQLSYQPHGQPRPLVDAVSFQLRAGERVALIGSSGSGKSTLLKLMLALQSATDGEVRCQQHPVRPASVRALRWYRQQVQYIAQDPATTLDPRRTVADVLAEPLRQLKRLQPDLLQLAAILAQVRLDASLLNQRCATLSGGQAQRVAIARAIALQPRFLLADEPVSGLDLPLRQQINHLLADIARQQQMGLLVVSHDLSSITCLCERVLVMDNGAIVEDAPTRQLLCHPQHPASQRLLDAIPRLPLAD
ncbi:peptide/nickel transport system ATP-binding protein [Erwinia toletana]|uniref:Peptide/nickel transport system ATP-binding protein n=1 Tax=Winslowiella toletana TaxID=92490 RepID=A0ABS4PBS5_9GAMM|nr:ABC transporter ATP-binding protein [Winslowiella toletana]MBP2170067.1 peptide/nickel transport system ATP-binding protein [Winslowiella toletana]